MNEEERKGKSRKTPDKKTVAIIAGVVFIILIAAAVLFFTGKLGPGSKQVPVQEQETSVDPAQNAATFAEYKDSLDTIFTNINKAMDGTDMEDEQEVLVLIDKIKPLYDQVATTTAPKGLEDTDATLKAACQRSSEVLQLSKDILTVGDNPTADDLVKVEQLQNAMTELNSVQTQIENALSVIYNTTTEQLNR